MKKLDLKRIDFRVFRDYFGVITFITFALGYIGFYSYCARYSLAFISPEVSIIAGIGILSILLVFGFYMASGGTLKRRATAVQAALFYFIVTILVSNANPIALFLALYILIDNVEDLSFSSKPKTFSEKRKRLRRILRGNRFWHILIIVSFLSLGFFFNYKIPITWIFISTAILIFRRLRHGTIELYKIILVVFLAPIFIFGFLLTDFGFTFFGLTRIAVNVTKKDKTVFKGRLIYRDNDFFYFEDSTNIQMANAPFSDIKGSMVISRDEISNYKIDTVAKITDRSKSFLDLLREIE